MNGALKWKLVAGFLLVFIAGGVTGAFLATGLTRHFLSEEVRHGVAANRMRERLRSELDLTPEQMAKISPIIDRTGSELERIRGDTARRVHETFVQAHDEISANLTEEQKAKLEQIRGRHQHRWHHRHGKNPPPP